jgi:hypothetical protein
MNTDGISKCPDALTPILGSVNLLPDNLEGFEHDLDELLTQGFEPNSFRALVPIELEEIIKPRSFPSNIANLAYQLRRLANEKRILRDIIAAFRKWETDYGSQGQRIIPALFGLQSCDGQDAGLLQLRPSFALSRPPNGFNFNDDSTLSLLSFRILDILTRNKIPIERIRECVVCRKIFWVRRMERSAWFVPYCGTQCGNTHNGRKTRIREMEKGLDVKIQKLTHLQATLSPGNSLIADHSDRIGKLAAKIEAKKAKYNLV